MKNVICLIFHVNFRPAVVNTPDVRNETMIVNTSQWPKDQVRIVFDGDGVLFSDEAECIYQTQGLEAFRKFEQEKLHIALPEGPMHVFALKLQKLRNALGSDNKWRIRTFLVTARNGIANERALKTLEKWGLEIDETHFLGGLNKTPFLVVIDPVIFFDDSREHINRAKQYVPAAHILYGIQNVIVDGTAVASTTTPLVSNEVEKNTDH
jgi:5'-nucleotidase